MIYVLLNDESPILSRRVRMSKLYYSFYFLKWATDCYSVAAICVFSGFKNPNILWNLVLSFYFFDLVILIFWILRFFFRVLVVAIIRWIHFLFRLLRFLFNFLYTSFCLFFNLFKSPFNLNWPLKLFLLYNLAKPTEKTWKLNKLRVIQPMFNQKCQR